MHRDELNAAVTDRALFAERSDRCTRTPQEVDFETAGQSQIGRIRTLTPNGFSSRGGPFEG